MRVEFQDMADDIAAKDAVIQELYGRMTHSLRRGAELISANKDAKVKREALNAWR